jgi:transcription antitermination factor NusA-like protein
MQTMRYINLLDEASRVKTKQCFVYNNIIFFAVPKALVSKAIGPSANNVKSIQEHLGKKVKIIASPAGLENASKFVQDLVAPNKFRSLEIKEGCIVLTAGNNQNKAVLIGRNKRRFEELEGIIQDVFGLCLKIV